MSHANQAPSENQGVEAYFTNYEPLRETFGNLISAPSLVKRLLIIHGVGGVGKSSLLRMFRLACRQARVPVGLASGDQHNSVLAILADWSDDLSADGVALPAFSRTYDQYKVLYSKAGQYVEKSDIAQRFAKGTVKTVASSAAGLIPVIGPIAGALGGLSAEALMELLLAKGFRKPDMDLLLDPASRLTDDFLTDVGKAASAQRLVLILDTYEQLAALDDWMRGFVERLHPNVLVVVAGREMAAMNWDQGWPGWLATADIHALEPMSAELTYELARRYYVTQVGREPNPQYLDRLIRFARGLPMAVTTAVKLWITYPETTDIEEIEAEVLEELVRRLREGVPPTMRPVLDAAAAVRYFNKPILRAVTGQADVDNAYDEIRRFPFVKPGKQGSQPVLRLHDSVREFLNRALAIDDPERYETLHANADRYFVNLAQKAALADVPGLRLEHLYHRVCINEREGMQIFQEVAEELVRFHLLDQLTSLLNDTADYGLELDSSRGWVDYYRGRLAQLQGDYDEASKVFHRLGAATHLDKKLRAYALLDEGEALRTYNQHSQAILVLERALSLVPLDAKLARGLVHLSGAYAWLMQVSKALEIAEQMIRYYRESGDSYGLIIALDRLFSFYAGQHLFAKAVEVRRQLLEVLRHLPVTVPYLKTMVLGGMGFARSHMGRLKDTEFDLQEALELATSLDLLNTIYIARDLGYVLGYSGRRAEHEGLFNLAYAAQHKIKSNTAFRNGTAVTLGFQGAVLLYEGRLAEAATLLNRSLDMKTELEDVIGIPELCFWLGELDEHVAKLVESEERYLALEQAALKYQKCLDASKPVHARIGDYWATGALSGLARVCYQLGQYPDAQAHVERAEELAQRLEYNDFMAALKLLRGHVAWDGRVKEWGSGFDVAEDYYRQALIYALRFNRFLLDEVLAGRREGTALLPIIPFCRDRGDEGKRMLEALAQWWRTGTNDTGAARPDTISPIPEGIALVDGERMARSNEPGDYSPQTPVLDQIEAALSQW